MFIDATITPTSHRRHIKTSAIIVTVILMAMMKVVWWQYAIVLLTSAVCLWLDHVRATPLYELSVKSPDDVWYLGVYDESRREVWQAHLSGVVSVGRALKLNFHVSTPFEVTHHVIIHRGMVSEADFRKLASLVRMG